jgi:hypothetical protein
MEFQQYTTSSPVSPFSQLSTDQSSPEGNQSAGETKPYINQFTGNMMQTVPGNFYGMTSNPYVSLSHEGVTDV